MIDYIEKQSDGWLSIRSRTGVFRADEALSTVLSRWMMPHLTTVGARIATTKKVFGLKSMVPLYVDGETLLFPIRSIRSETAKLINFYAVKTFRRTKGEQATLDFWDGTETEAGRLSSLRKRMEDCRRIDAHMSSVDATTQENAFRVQKPSFGSGIFPRKIV